MINFTLLKESKNSKMTATVSTKINILETSVCPIRTKLSAEWHNMNLS